MNPEKEINLKCKTPLMILSLSTLVLIILGNMSCFVIYNYDDGYKLTLAFPSLIDLILSLLSIAPPLLFVLYIFKIYKTLKAKIIFPILLLCVAFERLIILICRISANPISQILIPLMLDIFIIASFILATISSLNGFHNKKIITAAAIVGIANDIYLFISFFSYLEFHIAYKTYFWIFTNITYYIGQLAFFSAIIVFILNNKIPIILHQKANQTRGISPEQELRLLKDKYEFGQITEEEYQTQRAEIINKL